MVAHWTDEPRVECAWHTQYFGTTKTIREGADPASHGVCDRCAAILRRSAAKRKETRCRTRSRR
jgi:hypothetical protein